MDSLTALSTFVRAAETRGFTEAGRQLGVSASAVGKTVARLEERLGTRLFHRSTRSVMLTAEGILFLESSRRVIREIDSLEHKLEGLRHAPNGKLRVSLPIFPGLFQRPIKLFMANHPTIELDLSFSDTLVDVIDDGFDIAIRTGEGCDSRLMSRTVGTYGVEIVAAPNYLSRFGVPHSPEELLSHACLHHRLPTTGKLEPWPFVPGSIPDHLALPVSMAASTLEPIVSLAEAGAGIACLPDFISAERLADGRLERVLDGFLDRKGLFRAVWPSSRHLSPKIRAFVDTISRHLFSDQDIDDDEDNGGSGKTIDPAFVWAIGRGPTETSKDRKSV
jgi:DNA-binding transcriptional LysR family regulator